MVQDYLVGVPVGLNGLSKTIIAFGASYLNRWASADLGSLRILVIALLAIMDRAIIMASLFLLGLQVSPLRPADVLSSAVLTGVVGEVFFRLYDKIRFPPKDFRRLE
jgi:cell shape-determining protein MreD